MMSELKLKTSMEVEIDKEVPNNEIHVYDKNGEFVGKIKNIREENSK
ncbi:hypothetical protein [Virgibacillus profundi]|nr:hypothetical protein [Virgibacillus profundi]